MTGALAIHDHDAFFVFSPEDEPIYRYLDEPLPYSWLAPPTIRAGIYSDVDPSTFDLARFADLKNLLANWRNCAARQGKAPGVDGLTWRDFSPTELFDCLRRLSRDLTERRYRPYRTREAIVPKRGGSRRLELATLLDRLVSEALHQFLAPYLRQAFPPRSVWRIYADLEREVRESRRFVLTTADIRNFFPSVPVEPALGALEPHFRQPELLALIELVVRGHEDAAREVGLRQGDPNSPAVSEIYLQPYDARMESLTSHAFADRYVDNALFLSRDECEGEEALNCASALLRSLRLDLASDGDPVDLRDGRHGRVLLGLVPTWKNERLLFGIPTRTYDVLRENLEQLRNRPLPTVRALQYVDGWVRSAGPAFAMTEPERIIQRILRAAADAGFREIPRNRFREGALRSLQRWERLRSEATR